MDFDTEPNGILVPISSGGRFDAGESSKSPRGPATFFGSPPTSKGMEEMYGLSSPSTGGRRMPGDDYTSSLLRKTRGVAFTSASGSGPVVGTNGRSHRSFSVPEVDIKDRLALKLAFVCFG
jgi:hypothetical protein